MTTRAEATTAINNTDFNVAWAAALGHILQAHLWGHANFGGVSYYTNEHGVALPANAATVTLICNWVVNTSNTFKNELHNHVILTKSRLKNSPIANRFIVATQMGKQIGVALAHAAVQNIPPPLPPGHHGPMNLVGVPGAGGAHPLAPGIPVAAGPGAICPVLFTVMQRGMVGGVWRATLISAYPVTYDYAQGVAEL